MRKMCPDFQMASHAEDTHEPGASRTWKRQTQTLPVSRVWTLVKVRYYFYCYCHQIISSTLSFIRTGQFYAEVIKTKDLFSRIFPIMCAKSAFTIIILESYILLAFTYFIYSSTILQEQTIVRSSSTDSQTTGRKEEVCL